MQLLFVDQDRAAARKLHGEFLSYRGLQWDLVHCKDRDAAEQALDDSEFQVVLYHSLADFDSVRCDVDQILRAAAGQPVVTVLDNLAPREHLHLIHGGVHDSLIRSQVNGPSIMRQLRMADVRQSVWKRSAKSIAFEVLAQENYQGEVDPSLSGVKSEQTSAGQSPLVRFLPPNVKIAHVFDSSNVFDRSTSDRHEKELIAYERFPELRPLIERLTQEPSSFDAVLIEQSVFENERQSTLADLEPIVRSTPCTVLTIEKSDFAALSYIERGYADCLVLDGVSLDQIEHSICKSVVRFRRNLYEAISQVQIGEHVSDRRKSVRDGNNRRKHVRFLTQRPVLAIPMLPSGAPDRNQMCDATSIDVSLGGMALSIAHREQLPSRNWILGIEQPVGQYAYVNAYLRRVGYQSDRHEIGVIFQSEEHDFLSSRNLIPDINLNSKRFEYRTPDSVLRQWSELGVLRNELLHRARLCPECESALIVGTGCSECGSFRIRFLDLIHHFACANVDEAERFQRGGTFVCPKCLRDDLVVGADFEIVRSRYACEDCGHMGSETVDVGKCLACELRFPLGLAHEAEIYGYHVERLDILALVDSAR